LSDGPVQLRRGEVTGFRQQQAVGPHRDQDHGFSNSKRLQDRRRWHVMLRSFTFHTIPCAATAVKRAGNVRRDGSTGT
jgi:hypothetical protein